MHKFAKIILQNFKCEELLKFAHYIKYIIRVLEEKDRSKYCYKFLLKFIYAGKVENIWAAYKLFEGNTFIHDVDEASCLLKK